MAHADSALPGVRRDDGTGPGASNRDAYVNYYSCQACLHIWAIDKHDPSRVTNITPILRPRKISPLWPVAGAVRLAKDIRLWLTDSGPSQIRRSATPPCIHWRSLVQTGDWDRSLNYRQLTHRRPPNAVRGAKKRSGADRLGGRPIGILALLLSSRKGCPVVDRTGLTWPFLLDFVPDQQVSNPRLERSLPPWTDLLPPVPAVTNSRKTAGTQAGIGPGLWLSSVGLVALTCRIGGA